MFLFHEQATVCFLFFRLEAFWGQQEVIFFRVDRLLKYLENTICLFLYVFFISNNYTDRQHINHPPKTCIFRRPLKRLKLDCFSLAFVGHDAFHLKIINSIVFWRRCTPLVLIYSREKRRIKGFWQSFFCHIFVLGSPETPPPFFTLPFHSSPSLPLPLLFLREVKKASTELL